MPQLFIPTLLGSLLLCSATTSAQQSWPDSARIVALPDVAVYGSLHAQTIGTFHGKYIAGVRPLTPGVRCVVWLPSPDSGKTYTLNSLTIPLHCRYTAGRVQISLHGRGRGAELLGPALAARPLIITPPDSIPKRRTQLRLNLRTQQLQLPAGGIYVVIEGLPTQANESFVRYQSIQRRKTKKDGTTVVKPYVLTRRGTDTTTVWTLQDDFPKLRQSPAGYVSNTWMRWAPHFPYKRESAQTFGRHSVQAFDTVVLLELESPQ